MDLNTVCVCMAAAAIVAGVLIRRGYLRSPSPLDRIVDEFRREKAEAVAQAELRELAAKLAPPKAAS